MIRSAIISDDGVYRYELRRRWSDASEVAFIGLNPSTADAEVDDPTITRCIAFARFWGYGALRMVNLFAFRATQPEDMRKAADPLGPLNDTYLFDAWISCACTIACWGTCGAYLGRDVAVMRMFPGLKCLRKTKEGHPAHPLYLPSSCEPIDF